MYANGFSPVWVLLGFFKPQLCSNVLSHVLHCNGSSPMQVLVCFFKHQLFLNVFPQVMHAAKGFSPAWVLKSYIIKHHDKIVLLLFFTFMPLQTSAVFKCIFTCGACRGLLGSVGTLVFLETTALWKCLSSFSACRLVFSCVCPFVLLQASAVFKCLPKCFAWQWFLSCLGLFMLLQTSAPKCLNFFSHVLHDKGFSPVWFLPWLCFHASSNISSF